MTRKERLRIVAQLNGRTQLVAFEAAKTVLRDSDLTLQRPLIATLRSGRRSLNRTAAAYAMQWIGTTKAIEALERSVGNTSEHPRVRGQAAEALAHNHRRRSHNVLLRAIGDSSREVRFWCAFALGQMAEQKAIPALKRLASTDTRIVKGFWSVAKEAADALKNIQREKRSFRRKGVCAFCVSSSKRHLRG